MAERRGWLRAAVTVTSAVLVVIGPRSPWTEVAAGATVDIGDQSAEVVNVGVADADTGDNGAAGNGSDNDATVDQGDATVNSGDAANSSDGTAGISTGDATATGNRVATTVVQSDFGPGGDAIDIGDQRAGVVNVGGAFAGTGDNDAVGNDSDNDAAVDQGDGTLNSGSASNSSDGTAGISTGDANACGNIAATTIVQHRGSGPAPEVEPAVMPDSCVRVSDCVDPGGCVPCPAGETCCPSGAPVNPVTGRCGPNAVVCPEGTIQGISSETGGVTCAACPTERVFDPADYPDVTFVRASNCGGPVLGCESLGTCPPATLPRTGAGVSELAWAGLAMVLTGAAMRRARSSIVERDERIALV